MSTQTIPVGQAPRIFLAESKGDLHIDVWDERTVEIETDDAITFEQTAEGLFIRNITSDLRLRAPSDASITIENQHGDVEARGIQALVLTTIHGDAKLEAISTSVQAHDITGDLRCSGGESLVLTGSVEGDVTVRNVHLVEIEAVNGDCVIADAATALIGNVGGDCMLKGISETLRYGNVGGDLGIQGSAQTAISGGNVGGDCAIEPALSIQIGETGGDVKIRHVAGDLHLSSTGGDCMIEQVSGALRLGQVGGDAKLHDVGADLGIGNIGGDLSLSTVFSPHSTTRITVGGDARISLPAEPDLTIQAVVGGSVSGHRVVSSSGGVITIVYGAGAAQLDLVVGGDLRLGGGTPRASSSSGSGWDEFSAEMDRFGEELGEELGRLGEELSRSLGATFGGWGERMGNDWSRKAERQAERVRHRLERQMRHVEKQARRVEQRVDERGKRVRVRINDREWHFDPERVEQIKRRARQAAQEGIAGAMEAVDRALAGMAAPPAPRPPAPPTPPAPHQPAPYQPATGRTMRIDIAQPDAASAPSAEPTQASDMPVQSPELDRTAILRMVAEGRISPEEGEMLLDALG
jgi:SHOCT-like domain